MLEYYLHNFRIKDNKNKFTEEEKNKREPDEDNLQIPKTKVFKRESSNIEPISTASNSNFGDDYLFENKSTLKTDRISSNYHNENSNFELNNFDLNTKSSDLKRSPPNKKDTSNLTKDNRRSLNSLNFNQIKEENIPIKDLFSKKSVKPISTATQDQYDNKDLKSISKKQKLPQKISKNKNSEKLNKNEKSIDNKVENLNNSSLNLFDSDASKSTPTKAEKKILKKTKDVKLPLKNEDMILADNSGEISSSKIKTKTLETSQQEKSGNMKTIDDNLYNNDKNVKHVKKKK